MPNPEPSAACPRRPHTPCPPASPAEAARALRALAARLPTAQPPLATLEALGDGLLAQGLHGFTLTLAWRCLREACTGSPDMLPEAPYRFRLWWQEASAGERRAVLQAAALVAELHPGEVPRPFARLPPWLAGAGPMRVLESFTWPVEDSAAWCLFNHLLGPVAEHSRRAEEALLVEGNVPAWVRHEVHATLALLRLPVRKASWRLAARLLLGTREERAAMARQLSAVRHSLGFTA